MNKPTEEQLNVWRGEFELWDCGSMSMEEWRRFNLNSVGRYADYKLENCWISYLAARTKALEEILQVHEMYRVIYLKRGKSVVPQLMEHAIEIQKRDKLLEQAKPYIKKELYLGCRVNHPDGEMDILRSAEKEDLLIKWLKEYEELKK